MDGICRSVRLLPQMRIHHPNHRSEPKHKDTQQPTQIDHDDNNQKQCILEDCVDNTASFEKSVDQFQQECTEN